jgi:hypothetical protein
LVPGTPRVFPERFAAREAGNFKILSKY